MEAKTILSETQGTAHTNKSLPHEETGRAVRSQCLPEGKKVFLIRTAEGKRHIVSSSSNTLRVLPVGSPDGTMYNQVKVLDGGVWETVMTSPFGFEIAIVSEDVA